MYMNCMRGWVRGSGVCFLSHVVCDGVSLSSSGGDESKVQMSRWTCLKSNPDFTVASVEDTKFVGPIRCQCVPGHVRSVAGNKSR